MRLFGSAKSNGAFLSWSLASLCGVLMLQATPAVAQQTRLIAASTSTKTKTKTTTKTTTRTYYASAALIHAYNDLRQGLLDQAITDLCNILRADPNDVYARRYLCYALLQTGDARNCLTQLDVLARFNRSIAFDLCMRADALEALGQTKQAVETLKAANNMAPDNDYIRDAMIKELQVGNDVPEAIAACAEGYYKTKDPQARQRYLELFYQLQSENQLASQEHTPSTTTTPGATTTSATTTSTSTSSQGRVVGKASNWVPAAKDAPAD